MRRVSLLDRLGKIDKVVFAKAVGIMCLSWGALPIVYYLLLKKKGKKEKDERKE